MLEKIKEIAKSYFNDLDKNDFSHNFTHVERVTRLALYIGKLEGGDEEVLEVASLLHDIARGAQDRGEVKDHAEESARLAKDILNKVGFHKDKIDNVVHTISVHRCTPEKPPKSLEAKILQDADRLDALGAVAVARAIGSSFQSKGHKRPIYKDEPYNGLGDSNKSTVHYISHEIRQPKRKPENFNTETGRKIAKERYEFSKEYVERFIKEWRGEI